MLNNPLQAEKICGKNGGRNKGTKAWSTPSFISPFRHKKPRKKTKEVCQVVLKRTEKWMMSIFQIGSNSSKNLQLLKLSQAAGKIISRLLLKEKKKKRRKRAIPQSCTQN